MENGDALLQPRVEIAKKKKKTKKNPLVITISDSKDCSTLLSNPHIIKIKDRKSR